jgi:phage FluMu gp28-like protein
MSAPVTPAMLAAAGPRFISDAEWQHLRQESLYGLPDELRSLSADEILLGYQKRLLEATSLHAVVVVEKSRRTGATWALGADAVLTSGASRAAGGMDTIYIGYNLDMAKEFIDVAGMWARQFNQAATAVSESLFDDGDPDSKIQALTIKFASGFEIMALSSKPRSLRGRQGYVIIDEAAFHDNLPAVLQAAMALLIWGGKVCIISTHDGEMNAFNDLIQEIRAGKKDYALVRFDFDDALKDGLFERICQRKGTPWSVEAEGKWRSEIIGYYGSFADEELFCIPSQGGGAYLPLPLIEARSRADIPVIRLEKDDAFTHWPKHLREAEIFTWFEREIRPILKDLDQALPHALGVDFGRVSDLTVMVPLQTTRLLVRRTPFILELRNIPFEQQWQTLSLLYEGMPRRGAIKIDATGNGAYLGEVAVQRYGEIRVEAVKMSESIYREMFPPLKSAFEDGAIEIPADLDIRDDLRLVTVIAGVPRIPELRNTQRGEAGKSSDAKKKRHGDAAVALMLAYAASRQGVAEFAYDVASSGHAWGDEDNDNHEARSRSRSRYGF